MFAFNRPFITLILLLIESNHNLAIKYKPGKGDFCPEPSCIDKITKWSILGVQGKRLIAITRKAIRLKSIIIGNCVAEKAEYDEYLLKLALHVDDDQLHSNIASIFQIEGNNRLPDIFFVEQINCNPFVKRDSLQACPSAIVCWNESGSYSCEKKKQNVIISNNQIRVVVCLINSCFQSITADCLLIISNLLLSSSSLILFFKFIYFYTFSQMKWLLMALNKESRTRMPQQTI